MTQDILNKMEERRLAKGNTELYKGFDKQMRTMWIMTKEVNYEQSCDEIEDLEKKNVQMMQQMVRQVTQKNKKSLTGCLEDSDGSFFMDEGSLKRRWTECIQDLYADAERKEKTQIKRPMCGQNIDISEGKQAMEKIKANNSAGSEGIAIELMEVFGYFGVEKLTGIAYQVYNAEESLKPC